MRSQLFGCKDITAPTTVLRDNRCPRKCAFSQRFSPPRPLSCRRAMSKQPFQFYSASPAAAAAEAAAGGGGIGGSAARQQPTARTPLCCDARHCTALNSFIRCLVSCKQQLRARRGPFSCSRYRTHVRFRALVKCSFFSCCAVWETLGQRRIGDDAVRVSGDGRRR
jgi:hypothetical protein